MTGKKTRLLMMIPLLWLGQSASSTVLSPSNPASFLQLAETDRLFQSFNVEMVEITGGRFWASYNSAAGERYAFRPPIDLQNKRLRSAARALAPAYMRVSGTWANSTYIPTLEEIESDRVPQGFKQRLKRAQWQNLVRFSIDLGLPIVTSMPASEGTRNAAGEWQSEQALRLFVLTKAYGGSIAAAEFVNEPNLVTLGALPKGYNASSFARDSVSFHAFIRNHSPATRILGPGTSGAGGELPTEAAVRAAASHIDAVSYHFYGALSQRCKDDDVRADDALSEEWLGRTDQDYLLYAGLRDTYAPGRKIWLTETAQAACGGSPWAATWRDSFRYVDQMSRLARHGVHMVAHNTLAASDYALIDGDSLDPRPSYWSAVLWRRTMGHIVLQAPPSPNPDVRLYAHCLNGHKGGVAMLALNLSKTDVAFAVMGRAKAYAMTADQLDASVIKINGRIPRIGPNGEFPIIMPRMIRGTINLPATSIAYITFEKADNPACRN